MQCPNCSEKFAYFSVPFENRKMGTWRTIFLCPNCSVWLEPYRRFMLLAYLGLVLIALGIVILLISMFFNVVVSYHMILLLVGVGILLFILGVAKVKLKILN